ncbi:hypothetical protein Q1695_013703 [Nippostrongylus brasiliensis]|nr:hypothetical protein Q1695_013703 [Nippostrongylus brasiliensis]
MARLRLPLPSRCPQHDTAVPDRFYGLPYVDLSERPEPIQRPNRDDGLPFTDLSAPGFPFWGSRTTHAYNVLVQFIISEYSKHGFYEAIAPNMYPYSLWEPLGRWQFFSQEIQRLKVMRGDMITAGCSGHCLFFGHRIPLASELPIRFSDFSVVYRRNGTASPLPLPFECGMSEDDSHIFCRPDQIIQEIKVMAELSTAGHDCCTGDASLWDATENILKKEFRRRRIPLKTREGAAPFYGPRVDLTFRDCNGRYYLRGSIQVDFELPERFALAFVERNKQMRTPVLIHCAIIPSAETVLAIIANDCGEYWPFWLSLHQAIVIPVCSASIQYAQQVVNELLDADFEVDGNFDCSGTLSRRIRAAVVSKYNFILVVGNAESEHGTVNVRMRNDFVLGEFPFIELLRGFRSFVTQHYTDRQCIESLLNFRELMAVFLNVNYERDDLLPVMLIVFNLVPVSIFLTVMSFTIVINFGTALVIEMAALVFCLAWLVPSMILCSVTALIFWHAIQFTRFVIGTYVERSINRSLSSHQKFC